MATTYMGLDEMDKAIEILKAHNAGGLYNDRIGQTLAICGRTEEAEPFLSRAMAKLVADLANLIVGYINVYFKRGDHASAQAILDLGIGFFLGMRDGDKPNYLDKVSSALITALACSQFLSGQEDEARRTFKRARELAAFFDAAPSYDESDIRFVTRIEGASAYDDIGSTATDGMDRVVNEFENEDLTAFWNQVKEQENANG